MDAAIPKLASSLGQANRLKAEFIANVSHELRTPIHAIIGYAELLQDGIYGPLTADQEQTLQFLQDTAHDLLSLINNLLDVARLESGRADLILSAFDLRDLIGEAFQQIKPLADAQHLTLESRVSLDRPILRTDRPKLKQILLNLLGNAIKFTPSGRVSVTVTADPATPAADRRPRRLLLTVQDTGTGIAADKLDRIFEKFYQADASAARAHEGTGLGLYISKQLTELLAANIQVQSAPGQGTSVTISLPVNYEEVEAIRRLRSCLAATAGAPDQPANRGRLVLVVSDHHDIAKILTDALGSAEYRVRVEPASDQVAILAQQLQPLVILLDAQHSSHEFWSVFQELKCRPETRTIPTIFLGNDSIAGLGAPITVSAPLKPSEVLRSVRAATAHGRKKVLIVDDDDAFRGILQCALAEEGYQIEEASNGKEVLRQLTQTRPDLLLLDLLMPGLDGWAVIRHLAQHPEFKDIQVLVITGDTLDDQQTVALAAQTRGLIHKAEFKVDTMLEKVASALEVT